MPGVEDLLIQQQAQQQAQAAPQQEEENMLSAVSISGLDKSGQERIVFKYSDGMTAVETLTELQNLGIDEQILMQMGQVLAEIGFSVRQFNTKGQGQPQAAQPAPPAGGGMPPPMG